MSDVKIREPGGLKRAAANFIAGILVGIARLIYGVARTVFVLIESLV